MNKVDVTQNKEEYREVNNVTVSFELLIESIEAYQDVIANKINELSRKREWKQIEDISQQGKGIDGFISEAKNFKKKWITFAFNEDDYSNDDGDNREEVATITRINWNKIGDKIRVETKRQEGTTYSNIIPILLFKEISFCALKHIENQSYVKTSNILNEMGNEITIKSDYKKSPRTVIHATFKVLMKNELLKTHEENSHKYILANNKEGFISWINELG